MYDSVYPCQGFFSEAETGNPSGGRDGVKGAFFAFISTLDTGLPTSTIGLGSNVRFFLRFDP